MTKVYIIESEAGWGKRVDETLEFDTKKLVEEYVNEYNGRHNTADVTQSWYMYATIA